MRRLARRVITVFSAVSFILSVGVCALWMRSYWRTDEVEIALRRPPSPVLLGMTSKGGGLMIGISNCPPDWPAFPSVRFGHRPELAEWLHFLYLGRGWRHTFGGVFTATGTLPSSGIRLRLVHVPMYFVVLVLLLPAGMSWLRTRRERLATLRTAADMCPSCGYDLRATPGRCPECGTPAALAASPAAPPG